MVEETVLSKRKEHTLRRFLTCMFDVEISFLSRGISVNFLYIHRHIFRRLGVDVLGRFFCIRTGMWFRQIPCWPHRSWVKVCFYRHTGTSFCLVLCGVHSWKAGAPLCRHTDMFLRRAPCWVHRCHGIHLQSLDKDSPTSSVHLTGVKQLKALKAVSMVFIKGCAQTWVCPFTRKFKTIAMSSRQRPLW